MEEIIDRVIHLFLIPRYDEIGARATGNWAEVTRAEGASIIAPKYTGAIETGRPPGNRPPIQPLIGWARAKFNVGEEEARRIAWAVSTKIMKEGSKARSDPRDLLSVLSSPAVVDFIRRELTKEIIKNIRNG